MLFRSVRQAQDGGRDAMLWRVGRPVVPRDSLKSPRSTEPAWLGGYAGAPVGPASEDGRTALNKRQALEPVARAWLGQVVTGGVCTGLFVLLSLSVVNTTWSISPETPVGEAAIIEIGKHFFSDYLLPFELASVLLLIALIGAIVLARREFIPDVSPGSPDSEALQLPERPRELVSAADLRDS